MKTFTCKMCGKDFESNANHADYCVECRAERQRIRTRTYTAKKKNNEETKTVGQADICEFCGKPFIRASGSQKVCENCREQYNKKQNQKPHDNYVSRNYDVIKVYVKKGEREKLKEIAASAGASVNELINYGISLAVKEISAFQEEKAEQNQDE